MTKSVWSIGAVLLALVSAVFPAIGQEGLIGAGDILYIEVYRVPELTLSLQVDADGNIAMPYVGSIRVEGMSRGEAAGQVSRALQKILRNPRVTVVKSAMRLAGPAKGRTSKMTMEIIPLQNANAESLSGLLKGMNSEGGNISYDPDTNSLIVTDTPDAVRNMINVISRLDQMQSQLIQVRIETKIAEVRVGALKELGIRWFAQGTEGVAGFSPVLTQSSALNSLRGNLGPLANELLAGSNSQSGTGNTTSTVSFVDRVIDRRLNVPIQIPLPGQSFLGFMNPHLDIGALIDALASDDEATLLANPMIVTVNHKPAVIKMVDEFPYTEFGTEITGATSFSTKFMDLGIVLDATPHVYQDSHGPYVKLDLKVEVSFPVGVSNGVPIRSLRSSTSQASVRDGQTVVIGGILRDEERHMVSKIPGLGDLPVIGMLFRRKEKTKFRSELMIFVTPNIYRRPEEITWDRMIDISEKLNAASLIPVAELRGEERKD